MRESMVITTLQTRDIGPGRRSTNLQGEAASPDLEPYAVERDQPWPGGRYNHYLFDMNRDWFAQTQPETRGRSALYREFWPQVVVDLHEMGGDSSYYFAPPADPLNPHITKNQQKWFDAFGRANGAMFDARGFAYFSREVYDSFYPGYGESWPIFQGAIGMTYEQASARGLRYRREDGDTLSYRDGVLRHFTAAITTAETAAKNRAAILRDFYEHRRSAVSEGETGPVREYLLVPGADPSRAERLARLLTAQGIEVSRAAEPFKTGPRALPAGTWIVSAAQPSGRLVRNLLDKEILQPEAFIKEQDRRRVRSSAIRSTTSPAGACPSPSTSEVVTADRPTQARATPMAQYLAATETAAQAATVAPVGAPPRSASCCQGMARPASPPTRCVRESACARRPAVHARLPCLRARHSSARTAENAATCRPRWRAGPHARRRARAHRHRIRRQRHVARQRIDGGLKAPRV